MIHASLQLARREFSFAVDFQSDSPVTGVFGPSGAGKTTLVHLIAGLERPDHGMISVNGHTLFDTNRKMNVPTHRRRLGVVFQEHRLFPHLSVKGNLLYGCTLPAHGGLRTREFTSIVDLLELGPLLERRVTEISGGERQRVALGRAVLSQPRLLLLDEPLASLDVRLKQQIIPYLRRVRDVLAIPMLYVSHDLTELLQLTDRLLVLEQGRVAGYGRYADLVHDQLVLSVVHDRGMNNVLNARVRSHGPTDGVSVLELGDKAQPAHASELIAPLAPAAPGARVTVSIQPWDIALATQPVREVSIQNQFRGSVVRVSAHDRSMLVEIDIGAHLIVEISRRSAAALNITPGQPIICLIKSHAIRYVSPIA